MNYLAFTDEQKELHREQDEIANIEAMPQRQKYQREHVRCVFVAKEDETLEHISINETFIYFKAQAKSKIWNQYTQCLKKLTMLIDLFFSGRRINYVVLKNFYIDIHILILLNFWFRASFLPRENKEGKYDFNKVFEFYS